MEEVAFLGNILHPYRKNRFAAQTVSQWVMLLYIFKKMQAIFITVPFWESSVCTIDFFSGSRIKYC